MRDNSFKDFILDQLESLGDISTRARFGGYGIYDKNATDTGKHPRLEGRYSRRI